MVPFFTGAILLLNTEHVLFQAINCSHVINIKSIGYCCACRNLHHYGIVFDHCWKFYLKSLVEI